MNSSDLMSFATLIYRLGGRILFPVSLLLCLWGCAKTDAPPPSLTLEQLPVALQKAFAKARPEAKEKLDTVVAALREKDYSAALMALQTVSALPGLNREQASVAGAGLVTLNNALQEAQSQGDQNAAQTLQSYRSSK